MNNLNNHPEILQYLTKKVFDAVLECSYEIVPDKITLYHNKHVAGPNALNQLHLRIEKALSAALNTEVQPLNTDCSKKGGVNTPPTTPRPSPPRPQTPYEAGYRTANAHQKRFSTHEKFFCEEPT